MKVSGFKFWSVLIFVIFIIACKNENQNEDNEIIIEKSVSKNISNRKFNLEEVSKIELLSYPDRLMWDTIKFNGEKAEYKELIFNNKFTFDSSLIKERIVLNEKQKLKLYNILACDTCVPQEDVAACYMPRHLIVFKDKKGNSLAYDEICFGCKGHHCSENLKDYQKFCVSDMENFFEEAGIKYFVNNYDRHDEDRKQEYFFLKGKGYIK